MTVIIMTIIDSEKRGKYFKKLIEWCKSIKEKQEGNPRWGLTRRGGVAPLPLGLRLPVGPLRGLGLRSPKGACACAVSRLLD